MIAVPLLLIWAFTGMGYEFGFVEKVWYGALPGDARARARAGVGRVHRARHRRRPPRSPPRRRPPGPTSRRPPSTCPPPTTRPRPTASGSPTASTPGRAATTPATCWSPSSARRARRWSRTAVRRADGAAAVGGLELPDARGLDRRSVGAHRLAGPRAGRRSCWPSPGSPRGSTSAACASAGAASPRHVSEATLDLAVDVPRASSPCSRSLAAIGVRCGPAVRTGVVVAEVLLIVQAALDVVGIARGHRPPEPATHLGYLAVSVLLLPLLVGRPGRPRARRRTRRARTTSSPRWPAASRSSSSCACTRRG